MNKASRSQNGSSLPSPLAWKNAFTAGVVSSSMARRSVGIGIVPARRDALRHDWGIVRDVVLVAKDRLQRVLAGGEAHLCFGTCATTVLAWSLAA
jgi:hypothetical protein